MASRRGKMAQSDRAKQFMPFDALKGFREALREKERIMVPKRDLSEEQKEELNLKLCQVKKNDRIVVEYFQNGEYVRARGRVTRLDIIGKILTVADTEVSFSDISDVTLISEQ